MQIRESWAGNILICHIIIQSEVIKEEKGREERTSAPRETEMSCCCAYLFSFVVERWKSGPLFKSSAPEPSHTLVPAVHLMALRP